MWDFSQIKVDALWIKLIRKNVAAGRSPYISKGGSLCQSEGTNQIVMSFSLPLVGCLLKKGPPKG